jgi:uncharacterized surface protein with fasciclin (FAS1) repeats
MTSKIAVVAAAAGISLAAAVGSAPAASSESAQAGHDHVRAGLSTGRSGHHARPGSPVRRRAVLALAADGSRTFGAGCRTLPRRGPGSKAGLADTPVAAAISREPELAELAYAIRLTGLAATLNTARALTVFAPDNAAFRALGADNLQALLATTPDLVRVLRFHLVAGRVPPAELARHHVVATVAGTKIHVFRSARSLGVNNATVTCGNVQTANATVYVVDRLVTPAS